jgi:hypothetical protein
MSKIRMFLAAVLMASVIAAGMMFAFPSAPAAGPTVVKIAEQPTPTPTPGNLPGCGPGGC